MTHRAGGIARVYLAQYDVSGDLNAAEILPRRNMAEGTGLLHSGRTWHPMLREDGFNLDAFYDNASDIATQVAAMRTATSVYLATICLGTSQGAIAFSGEGAWLEDNPLDAPIDGLIRGSWTFKFENRMRPCLLLQPKAEQAEDGESDGIDNAAASSAGAEAFLHVFACDVPDLVIQVQHDSDAEFGSPANLITFTTVTGATSERKAATGAIERYVRLAWSGTWTGDKTATFAVAFARL